MITTLTTGPRLRRLIIAACVTFLLLASTVSSAGLLPVKITTTVAKPPATKSSILSTTIPTGTLPLPSDLTTTTVTTSSSDFLLPTPTPSTPAVVPSDPSLGGLAACPPPLVPNILQLESVSFCYLILPSRRKHPHLIVLVFSIMMVPWEGLGTAWLHMRTDLLCKNIYEPATMTNSWFCGVQGMGKRTVERHFRFGIAGCLNCISDILFS
ncbi:hypothetical protein F5H01DRAFT_186919, partial [Linnemannia elongata]